MRLLSAFIDCACFILLLSWLSCASTSPSIKSEEKHIFTGKVTVTGDFPFKSQIVLVTGNGITWILSNPDLEYELIRLAGHDIKIEGTVAEDLNSGPTVLVEDYEMMPVAGRSPVIGTLVPDGGQLHLVVPGTGKRYILTGQLKEALMHFLGLKVWVCGDEATGYGIGGEEAVYNLNVEGYGILGPPGHSIYPEISDTLQDFRNR